MQYVYLLENKYSPNVYKIGWTSRHPEIRAKEISQGTGVVGNWEVSYQWEVEDGYWLEQEIFRHFSLHRIEKSEMFHFNNLSSAQVYEKVCQLIKTNGDSPKIWREIKEKEASERNEMRSLRIAITNLKDQIINIETKPYKEELSTHYKIYWVVIICIFSYIIQIYASNTTIFGSIFSGVILGSISLFVMCLFMSDFLDNLLSEAGKKIQEIHKKYSEYDNYTDDLAKLRSMYFQLECKIKRIQK